MSPKALRILATCYLVKTLLIGLLCFAIPDLPRRASELARAQWARGKDALRTHAPTPEDAIAPDHGPRN